MQVTGVACAEQVTTLKLCIFNWPNMYHKKFFAYLTVVLISMLMYSKICKNRNLTMAFWAKYQQNTKVDWAHFSSHFFPFLSSSALRKSKGFGMQNLYFLKFNTCSSHYVDQVIGAVWIDSWRFAAPSTCHWNGN